MNLCCLLRHPAPCSLLALKDELFATATSINGGSSNSSSTTLPPSPAALASSGSGGRAPVPLFC